MKNTLLLALLFIGFQSKAQLYMTTTGEVSFFSKTPMEDIDAVNKSVSSIINTATNEVAVQMRITNFVFPNKLMQEHFNENYLESEKFPSATFKGKIKETVDLTVAGTYPITASGTATIHGVTRPIDLKGTIISTGTGLALTCAFEVKLVDYKVDIPKIVFAKIAEVIKVSSKINYTKK
ncbi:MAG: YceI family protein [Cytophagales bacterium]|nr:YceI family protein [Cytophagales bacterium]